MADEFALDPAEYGVTVSGPSGDAALDPGGPAAAAPSPQPGFLDRAWSSLKTIGPEIAKSPVFGGPGATPYVADGPPGIGKQLGEGFVQGVSDVAAPPTTWMLRQLGVGDTATKAAADRRQQFEEHFGDSTAASLGRVAGQTVATAPVIGAGGMAARAVARAVPAIAPAVTFLGGGTRLAPDANLAARLATAGSSLAAQGAVTGGTQGALTAGPDQSMLEGAAQGAEAGAILGPAIGAASYPVRALAGHVANMTDLDSARWGLLAARYGIDIDAAKMTTNPTYKLFADQGGKLPFSGVDDTVARRQWQRAVAEQFGETANRGITYDVMDRAARRVRGVFDGVANRTTIQADPPLFQDLTDMALDMPRYGLTAASPETPRIQAAARNVLSAFHQGNGQITGRAYQTLTQTGGPLDTLVSSTDPTTAAFGMRIRDALDGAFQRSATPQDQAALTEARRHYRALKTVEPLVEQRGMAGDINPNALLQKVIAQSRRFDPSTGGLAYTGGGPMGDLANIGNRFFSPAPDSGTAARNIMLGGVVGGGLVHALANPVTGIGAPAATLFANYLLQQGIRSPAVGRAMVEGTLNPASRGAQFSNQALVPAAVGLLRNYRAPP